MRVDGFFPSLNVEAPFSSDILSKINVGDILQARILEVSADDVLLQLLRGISNSGINQKNSQTNGIQIFAEGSLLKAAAKYPENIKKGEIINFQVKEKINNQVMLEKLDNDVSFRKGNYLEDNRTRSSHIGMERSLNGVSKPAADNIDSIVKALAKSKFEANDNNIKVAKELLHNNISINSKNVGALIELINNIDGLTVDKAVFLFANKIDPSFKNLNLLNRFIDEQVKIGAELDSLGNLLITPENKELLAGIVKELGINMVEAPSMERLDNILKSVFSKIFKDITSEKFVEEIDTHRLYTDVLNKLDIIERNVASIGASNRDLLLAGINDIKSDIKFMSDISHSNIYMQLPISFAGRNTTGELYILKKHGKTEKIDPANTTIIVSLELAYLGHIDSVINIEKNNIMINFRVANEKIVKLLKENFIALYTALGKKGYILKDIRYRLIDEDINLSNANRLIVKEFVQKNAIDYIL